MAQFCNPDGWITVTSWEQKGWLTMINGRCSLKSMDVHPVGRELATSTSAIFWSWNISLRARSRLNIAILATWRPTVLLHPSKGAFSNACATPSWMLILSPPHRWWIRIAGICWIMVCHTCTVVPRQRAQFGHPDSWITVTSRKIKGRMTMIKGRSDVI